MKTAIVTGVTGQDGGYLSKLLLEKGYKVYGVISRRINQSYENLEWLGIKDQINFVSADLTDQCSVQNIIKEIKPDEFYNLAAQSFVGLSWQMPVYVSLVNGMGVLYVLEGIRQFSPHTKLYQAGTSEMYGNSGGSEAKTELTPFIPRSPYGVAKAFAHNMVVNYRESYDMFACNGILFNHESPTRGVEFVTRKITDGVAKIKLGLSDKIVLGNLDAQRDWGYAEEFVEGMWRMLQQPSPDDYVLATGRTQSIRDFLDLSFAQVGIDDWSEYVEQSPEFFRPAELHILLGDSSKAREVLGWQAKTSLEELAKIMVDADLKRLS